MTRSRRPSASSFVLREIVMRSAPKPDRPRLPPEMEEQFRDIDARSAACYADLEDITYQLGETARALRAGELDVPVVRDDDDDDNVPEDVEAEHSLEIHVRDAREASQKRRADTDVFALAEQWRDK